MNSRISKEKTQNQKRAEIISALLKQAESTTYPEEAKTFSAKAQTLMAKWAIDDAMLGAVDGIDSLNIDVETMDIEADALGEMRGTLLYVIGLYNSTRVVREQPRNEVGDTVYRMHLVGAESDRHWTQTLYLSLVVQANAESAMAWMMSEPDERPQAFSQSFLQGYNSAIRAKMKEAADLAKFDAHKNYDRASVALVLQSKDDQIDLLMKDLFPNLHHTRAKSTRSNAGYTAGKVAGNKASTGRGNRVSSGAKRIGA